MSGPYGELPVGFQVVESPYMPANTFMIGGPVGGTRLWEAGVDDLRLLEPLWEPPRWPLDDVYVTERERAHRFLEGLLDGLCTDLGITHEVWRAPRRDLTRAAMWRSNVYAVAVEQRVAMSIRNPRDFAIVTAP